MYLFRIAIIFIFLSFFASEAVAKPEVRINGFGTIAATTSDSNELGFRRNCHSGDAVYEDSPSLIHDSNLGVQANINMTPDFRGVVQFLLKDRADNAIEDVVNYAFLEYNITADLAVRGGRIPLETFLLADYREVGFAYLWVRPVTEVYRTLFYDNYDGVDFRYRYWIGDGVADVKFYIGRLDTSFPLHEANDISFSFEPIWGVNAQYSLGEWRFIGAFQRGTVEDVSDHVEMVENAVAHIPESVFPYGSLLVDEISFNGSHSDYFSGGIAYENEQWVIKGEAARLRLQKAAGLTYNSGYVSVGYKFGQWTPYVVAAALHGNFSRKLPVLPALPANADPTMQQVVGALGAVVRSVYADHHTISFGTKWDIRENLNLKFQWDHTRISGGRNVYWERKDIRKSYDKEEVNVFTVALSFIF